MQSEIELYDEVDQMYRDYQLASSFNSDMKLKREDLLFQRKIRNLYNKIFWNKW